MPGELLILTGPPGAGKSTVGARLARRFPLSVHLHTDDFWHVIVSGAIPPYLPESDAQNQTVVAVAAGAAARYAQGGFTVVVDGIVGPWMLPHYRRLWEGDPELVVHYVVLRPDRTETLARAQARKAPALLEEGPIGSLWDQFADLGPLERHVVDTTEHAEDDTEAAVAEAIATGRFRLAP